MDYVSDVLVRINNFSLAGAWDIREKLRNASLIMTTVHYALSWPR